MKYIKEYYKHSENNIDNLELYDYVISDVKLSDDKMTYYLQNNIGQLVKITEDDFLYNVRYIAPDFDLSSYPLSWFTTVVIDKINYINMPLEPREIKYWSKDKSDLELVLNINKYNL